MNPVITIKKQTKLLVYKLTNKDKKRLKEVYIKPGAGVSYPGAPYKDMCIMQAVSMVTGEASEPLQGLDDRLRYTDKPLCVSPTIRSFMIGLNDSAISSEQRNELKKLIPVLLNTRPLKARELKSGKIREAPTTTSEYKEAENERRKLLREAPCRDKMGYFKVVNGADFKKIIQIIKKAANLYHTPTEGEDQEVITI